MAIYPAIILKNGLPQVAGASDQISNATSNSSTFPMTAAANLVKGQAVYSTGSGQAALAKGDASTTSRAIGLVSDVAIAITAVGNIVTSGALTIADWTAVTGGTALTPGVPYFVSAATAGQLTATSPSTSGQYSHQIGYALTATTMQLDIAPTVWSVP